MFVGLEIKEGMGLASLGTVLLTGLYMFVANVTRKERMVGVMKYNPELHWLISCEPSTRAKVSAIAGLYKISKSKLAGVLLAQATDIFFDVCFNTPKKDRHIFPGLDVIIENSKRIDGWQGRRKRDRTVQLPFSEPPVEESEQLPSSPDSETGL
jgi:hypothetical protein